MVKKYSRKTLSALFLEQRGKLSSRGISKNIDYFLRSERESVLLKAEAMTFEEQDVPFIPVIPFTHRSYFDQMPMIEIDGKTGKNENCQDGCIWNNTNYLHQRPWYIFKVSVGKRLNGESINSYCSELAKEGRRPLLPEELIGLCIQVEPKNASLYCHVPHSNPWSQSHLLTGEVPEGGLDAGFPSDGPAMFGLIGDIYSERRSLNIPSCLL